MIFDLEKFSVICDMLEDKGELGDYTVNLFAVRENHDFEKEIERIIVKRLPHFIDTGLNQDPKYYLDFPLICGEHAEFISKQLQIELSDLFFPYILKIDKQKFYNPWLMRVNS